MKRTAAVILSIVWLITVAEAEGYRGSGPEVEVVSEKGDLLRTIPCKVYSSGGTLVFKKYLEAKKGMDYAIVVRNNSPQRVGVVVAVDGRNVINGGESHLAGGEAMYVIKPYGWTKIEGWRTDGTTIHRFYFTDPGDSYSVRTFEDSSAMGVIAVAAFREKEGDGYPYGGSLRKAPGPAEDAAAKGLPGSDQVPAGRKKERSETAATGFGEEGYSPAIRVEFEPELTPVSKILIKYEWRGTLCRKGILKCRTGERNRLWDEESYSPFPPGYQWP